MDAFPFSFFYFVCFWSFGTRIAPRDDCLGMPIRDVCIVCVSPVHMSIECVNIETESERRECMLKTIEIKATRFTEFI